MAPTTAGHAGPNVLEDIVSTNIVTTAPGGNFNAGRTHLRWTDGQPAGHALNVAVRTACGREVTGIIGEHKAGALAGGITCKTCRGTSAFRNAERDQFLADHRAEVAQAESYVRSRFYPPLPVEYGALAVQAIHAVNDGDPYTLIPLGEHLDPLPRDAVDGKVTAARLVQILHLGHLIDDEAADLAYLD